MAPTRGASDDITRLVNYFLARFGRELAQKSPQMDSTAMLLPQANAWPGNGNLQGLIQEWLQAAKRGERADVHAQLIDATRLGQPAGSEWRGKRAGKNCALRKCGSGWGGRLRR